MSETITKNMETAANMQVIASTMMYGNVTRMDNSVHQFLVTMTGFSGTIQMLTVGFRSLLTVIKEGNLAILGLSRSKGIKQKIADFRLIGDKEEADINKAYMDFLKGGFGLNAASSTPQTSPSTSQSTSSSQTGLTSIGPMMKLYFIIKPLMELIKGLMEPLDPLMDIIGALGSILGLLLVPILEPIMSMLIPMIPILINAVTSLTPVIRLMMLPTTMIGLLIVKLQPHLEKVSFMMFGLAGMIGKGINSFQKIIDFFRNLFRQISNMLRFPLARRESVSAW